MPKPSDLVLEEDKLFVPALSGFEQKNEPLTSFQHWPSSKPKGSPPHRKRIIKQARKKFLKITPKIK